MQKGIIENENIRKKLWELQDADYKKFHGHLIPNISSNSIIGIKTPVLRKFAKELNEEYDCSNFIKELPHTYYEENNLHAFLIESIKDYDFCMQEVEKFLPYIDNWATCDSLSPKVFRKNKEQLLEKIKKWLQTNETYTVRFAIKMLMTYFLDDDFDKRYLQWVAAVISEEYYINMMRSWYFATALAKQYDATVVLLEGKELDSWTHTKTIQKAVESYRISEDHKKYLRSLRLKRRKNEINSI